MSNTVSGAGASMMTFMAPTCTNGPTNTSSCAQWNIGIACTITSLGLKSQAAMQLAYCAITASCVSIAPFGSDSVPLV